MPGYSGTPLPKKLGIKAGFRVQLANAPAEERAELCEALEECTEVKQAVALAFAMLFTKSRAALPRAFSLLAKPLAPAGMLCVCRPNKQHDPSPHLADN